MLDVVFKVDLIECILKLFSTSLFGFEGLLEDGLELFFLFDFPAEKEESSCDAAESDEFDEVRRYVAYNTAHL